MDNRCLFELLLLIVLADISSLFAANTDTLNISSIVASNFVSNTFIKDTTIIESNLEIEELELNTALLTINSSLQNEIEVWAQTEECFQCRQMLITKVNSFSTYTLLLNTTHKTDLRLLKLNKHSIREYLCGFNRTFQEGGKYLIFVNYTGDCSLFLTNIPTVAEIPLYFMSAGLAVLVIIYVACKKLYFYLKHRNENKEIGSDDMLTSTDSKEKGYSSIIVNKVDSKSQRKSVRLSSIDTFRGLVIILMVFFNYGGGEYWYFKRASWNGFTLADLTLPWFIFITGASINFSFRHMFRNGWSIKRIVFKIVRRTFNLFILGFMMSTHFEKADIENVRIFGVLQRIAVTYFISATTHYICTRRSDSHKDKRWAFVRDLVLYVSEWITNLIILSVHLLFMYLLPVPGCPTGYVGPGGISEKGINKDCTGGATRYVDSLIIGYKHLDKNPTTERIYQTTYSFDSEGLFGTLGSVFVCFLGIQCGRIILIFRSHRQRLIRFFIWAALLRTLGTLLTRSSRNYGWVPANRNIWSVSFTLISAAYGYILMFVIYILTDLLGVWQGQPLQYPGMNSIVIYICHYIFSNTLPFTFQVGRSRWKLLFRSVWGTVCWIIAAYCLYRRRIFIAL